MEMNAEALKWRAEDERRETFNALVLAYNKLQKSKPRKGEKQLAAWAMTKVDRIETLQRLMERYAKPGHKPFAWQKK
jgi:hypothetical protein